MQEFETPLTLGSPSSVVPDNDIWGSTETASDSQNEEKKTKPKKTSQNNLRQLRAFSTVVCLSTESGTAVTQENKSTGPSTAHEDIISHILPDPTSLLSHRLHRASETQS